MQHMEYKDRAKVYEEAIERYGVEKQMVVAIEELSECAKELCKAMRGKGDINHLAEEVADATIMLEQMRLTFGINDAVKFWMDAKLQRLQHRLLKEKEPVHCGACDYSRDSDMRCMCEQSQWAGLQVSPDNYCMHGTPRTDA